MPATSRPTSLFALTALLAACGTSAPDGATGANGAAGFGGAAATSPVGGAGGASATTTITTTAASGGAGGGSTTSASGGAGGATTTSSSTSTSTSGSTSTSTTTTTATKPCLAGGTDADLNAVFQNGGAGAEAVLCPGAVFTLNGTVAFTAPNQRLSTQGLPTDATRATLRVVGPSLATAVSGLGQSGVALESVQIDGNRPALGRIQNGGALVVLGGDASGQLVNHVRSFEPRGWSSMQVFEGTVTNDVPGCQGAHVTNSQFGPSGTFDGQQDGTWADGLSFACGNSLIDGNVVTDATDGGIVIFGAPGTEVRDNHVLAATRHLFGGINLVDFAPMNGNYAGTKVHDNVVEGNGAFVEIGIAMGAPIWFCSKDLNHGASITHNTVKGKDVGYGYAVNHVADWTVTDNVDTARHVGAIVSQCGAKPSAPAAFQAQNPGAGTTLQPEFQAASLTGLVWAITEAPILSVATSPKACGQMMGGEGLYPGDVLASCDGRFHLGLEASGDLVLRMNGQSLWSAGLAGKSSAVAIQQADGNVVVYDAAGTPIWSTVTANHPGAFLAVQNDGNLVVYSAQSAVLWASGTCCH